jgi:hypothetical protein
VVALSLERAVGPLDALRTACYRLAFAIPPLGRLVARRDRRVALTATLHALVAFSLAATVPTLLLALGPVALGAAHVVSDLRFLVLRRGLAKAWLGVIAVACVALIGIRAAYELGVAAEVSARLELGVTTAWMCVAAVAGAAVSRRRSRGALAVAVALALGAAAQAAPFTARLAFAHLHNVVALLLWLHLFRSRPRAVLLPLVLIVGLALFLLSGQTFAWTEHLGTSSVLGLHVLTAADTLAPGLPIREAAGLTVCFTFMQSVHYSTWLLVVPQEDVRGQGTATWRMAARSMLREMGTAGVVFMLLALAAVPIAACFDLHGTRTLYLSLAMFHGYLELALGVYFFTRGGIGGPGMSPQPATPSRAALAPPA